MENVDVVGGGATTTAFGSTDYTNVKFTAWIRNDDDEYRWCNRNPASKPDHGETSPDSGDCNNSGGYDPADDVIRLLTDEDSRVIVRVEARGRDGLSFAAVEAMVTGRTPVLIQNLYQQAGGSGGQNSNSVILR